MNIPYLLLMPSILMQKAYFQYAEDVKHSKIGEATSRRNQDISSTNLRIAAVAHAICQGVYAHFMAVPLVLTTAVTVLVTPSQTGFFTQEGMLIERLVVSVVVALASLSAPIAGSVMAAINPQELDNPESFSVQAPILAHGALVATTLPPLSVLGPQIAHDFGDTLQQALGGESVFGWVASHIVRFVGRTGVARTFLSELDLACYKWRILLPVAMHQQAVENRDFVHYDQAFDLTSQRFTHALITSVVAAHQAASVET